MVDLTANDFSILRRMRGNAVESQRIRERLHTVGLRFCGVCLSIRDVSAFGRDSRTKHGLRTLCRSCDKRSNRRRKGMVLYYFDGAERNQRHRDNADPEKLQEIYDRSNAQRDQANWRRWYERYKDRPTRHL